MHPSTPGMRQILTEIWYEEAKPGYIKPLLSLPQADP